MKTESGQLQIVVCKGPSCSLLGGDALQSWCEELVSAGLPVNHNISGCTGNCLESPVVQWNGRYLTECNPEKLTGQLIEDGCF